MLDLRTAIAQYFRVGRLIQRALCLLALGATLLAPPITADMLPCPPEGAELQVSLGPPPGSSVATAVAFGTLIEPSCTGADTRAATGYAVRINCAPDRAELCHGLVHALQPGRWTHRILVIEGESSGQLQARQSLLLAASAGVNRIGWRLYRSVVTVNSLADAAGCSGCLREAIARAEAGAKPALIQFAPEVVGTIALSAALPPLASGGVTIDGFDVEGRPLRRTIDGNGIDAAALKIASADNTILGLQVNNTGGDSDTILVEGPAANRNELDTLQVVGRALRPCGDDDRGCLVDGVCHTPATDPPRGACGDDGIAVRLNAGSDGVNVIRGCDVSGAFDKGIKVSDGAVARVERSRVHDNADGGVQATLSGEVIAVENLIEDNHGTNSANGLAANGPAVGSDRPARLVTAGNIVRNNALRGISVRSLSLATLRDDYVCGNGTAGRGIGFGIAVLDAAGFPAWTAAEGVAVVHNVDGGVVVANTSAADLGSAIVSGENVFAYNGPPLPASPVNLRNLSLNEIPAAHNQWEHCGSRRRCNESAVLTHDVFVAEGAGPVTIEPAQAIPRRGTPRIDAIEPPFAVAGEIVRIYGSGFDALDGNGPEATCEAIAIVNTCKRRKGNCVRFGREPAGVFAATPTMLAVKAPFTCVEPVTVTVRSSRAPGVGRHRFCVLPHPGDAPAGQSRQTTASLAPRRRNR